MFWAYPYSESTVDILLKYRIACRWLPSARHHLGEVESAIITAANIDAVSSVAVLEYSWSAFCLLGVRWMLDIDSVDG